ncbi:T9SS type A sorting domain-containing protein [Bacteroidota bacterium]
MGVQNDPKGQILNNTDAFGYVDEFTFSDSSMATLSVDENHLNNTVLLYPNPTTDSFTINTAKDTNIIQVSVFDTLGKDITNTVRKGLDNNYDVSSLKSGIYVVVLKDDKGNLINKKLLINN